MSFVLLFSKRKEWKRLENTGNILRNYYHLYYIIIITCIYFQVIISLKVCCFLTATSSAEESKRKAAEVGDQAAKRLKETGDN